MWEININFQYSVCGMFYSLKFSYNESWSYLPLPGSVGLDSVGANGSRNKIGKENLPWNALPQLCCMLDRPELST